MSFDPNQPRDDRGEWTSGSAGGVMRPTDADIKPPKKAPRRPRDDQLPQGNKIIAGGMVVGDRSDFDLKLVKLDNLKPTEDTDTPRIVEKYREQFEAGKRVEPIVVDRFGRIRDGHHRYYAALKAGLTHIWAMRQRNKAR